MSIFFLRAANISTFFTVTKIKSTGQVHDIYMLLLLSNVFPLTKEIIFVHVIVNQTISVCIKQANNKHPQPRALFAHKQEKNMVVINHTQSE